MNDNLWKSKWKFVNIVEFWKNAIDSKDESFWLFYDSHPSFPCQRKIFRSCSHSKHYRRGICNMAIANEYGIPVTPRGTAKVVALGGAFLFVEVPNTSSHDKIIRIRWREHDDYSKAGVRTIDVYNYCAEKGLFFLQIQLVGKYSTIGGNVAENAGGMRTFKMGWPVIMSRTWSRISWR